MNAASPLLRAIPDLALRLRFSRRNVPVYSFHSHQANHCSGISHATAEQHLKLVLLGAPGVGKGTYAGQLAKTWQIPHISTGDLFRREIAADTSLGQLVKDICTNGELVPDQLVSELCKRRLGNSDCSVGWILDGFPRTVSQAKILSTFAPPTLCVSLFLRRDILLMKLLARRICADCGASFNFAEFAEGPYELPPIRPPAGCKKCRGNPTLLKRPDDTEVIIKRRLKLYDEQAAPILRFYEEGNLLFKFEMKKGLKDVPTLATHILARLHDADKQQELCR